MLALTYPEGNVDNLAKDEVLALRLRILGSVVHHQVILLVLHRHFRNGLAQELARPDQLEAGDLPVLELVDVVVHIQDRDGLAFQDLSYLLVDLGLVIGGLFGQFFLFFGRFCRSSNNHHVTDGLLRLLETPVAAALALLYLIARYNLGNIKFGLVLDEVGIEGRLTPRNRNRLCGTHA